MTGSKKIFSKLAVLAKREGNKKAIIEADTGRVITYKELFCAILALQKYFGDNSQKILVALPGGIIDSIIWLTSLTNGNFFIPVSPYLTRFEFSNITEMHKPDLIISEKKLPTFERVIKNYSRENEYLLYTPKDGQVYLSTSGSTGVPKGVILTSAQITQTAVNIILSHHITSSDKGLTPLPFFHVNAPVVSLMTSILSGSTLIIAPKYSTSHFWKWVKKYKPTWISLVPTMIAMLLTTPRPSFLDHSSLRFIRTASEPLSVENLKRFENKFNIPVIETYGLSEAASTVAANPVPPEMHKPGSVGLPLGVSINICDVNTGKALSKGEIGEICIKGKNIIKKYENVKSNKSFIKGWLKTGDLGFVDSDGYIHITGRIKDIIIRGGENISPREIEEVLLTYPSVLEATVVGVPDPIYGEVVVGFVVLYDNENKNTTAKIGDFISKKLTPSKIPERICILDNLPRNKTGKVDKVRLRSSLQSGNL